MLSLRAEYSEGKIYKGKIYKASVTRGFIHPLDYRQFDRKVNEQEDFGRLVIFVDTYIDDELVTTFCYNTLEFNERWTLLT